tara:strand:+ start:442 stop:708 length:267 start_codon:yes stop_codon:yes gene_type:complete
MKKFIIACLLLCACENKQSKPVFKKEIRTTYEIICKHPLGHIENFKVDKSNFIRPSNHRGGIWSFTTIDEVLIRSSNCHSSSKSIQME